MISIPGEYLKKCDTLFLDRDGVINQWLPGDYVKRWDEFHFIPDFLDSVKEWNVFFKRIFVVTNQRGVGRGLMSREDLDEIHCRMVREIVERGGRIDRIYVCVSINENDPMRKPNPGMAHLAMLDFPDVSMSSSLMIGDQKSDSLFAKNAGMNFFKFS